MMPGSGARFAPTREGGDAGGGRHRDRPHRHRRDRDRHHQRDRRSQPAGRLTDSAGDDLGRPPDALPRPATRGGAILRRSRRHAGVYRRAVRRELNRIREPRRLVAIIILGVVLGVFGAGLAARGEAAGADAHAYWAGVRIWLAGGDPYQAVGPFMPYVYAPWMLPLFLPWALLPWDVAWFAWRGATILLLLWTVAWAYRRRPLETALVVLLLSFPIAANVDTGNINLAIVFMLWAAQIVRPVIAGLLWALATAMKWVPVVFIVLLAPRARGWGLIWAGVAVILTLATLPATIVQVQTVFAFPRPARIDYFVLLWAAVPWVWRHPAPFWWARPSAWPAIAGRVRAWGGRWGTRFRASPADAGASAARSLATRTRAFFGLG
ncbi:MAG: glycosyltransferase family 87 protein [Chloroflexota bacterium]